MTANAGFVAMDEAFERRPFKTYRPVYGNATQEITNQPNELVTVSPANATRINLVWRNKEYPSEMQASRRRRRRGRRRRKRRRKRRDEMFEGESIDVVNDY